MNKKIAQNLINKTRNDYNKISGQFSSTRHYNWGDYSKILKQLSIKPDSKIADIGCGNGRVFELFKNQSFNYYGLDISDELIKIAKKSYPKGNFIVGSALELPYKNNFFDLVISIAALHHIPGQENRQKAIEEIFRVTKSGGKIFITNWYFWNKSKYLKMIFRSTLNIIFKKSDLDFGDFMMPWKNSFGKIETERYFHAWKINELKSELKKAGFKNIKIFNINNKKYFWNTGNNLIITAEK